MKEWLEQNIYNLLMALIGGSSTLGYIFERNKRKIENRHNASDALKSMQEAYDKFTEDYLKRYETLRLELEKLGKDLEIVTEKLKEETRKYSEAQLNYEKILRDFEDYRYKEVNKTK